jgi:hypothetical protein
MEGNVTKHHIQTQIAAACAGGAGAGRAAGGDNATRGQIAKIVYLAVTQP